MSRISQNISRSILIYRTCLKRFKTAFGFTDVMGLVFIKVWYVIGSFYLYLHFSLPWIGYIQYYSILLLFIIIFFPPFICCPLKCLGAIFATGNSEFNILWSWDTEKRENLSHVPFSQASKILNAPTSLFFAHIFVKIWPVNSFEWILQFFCKLVCSSKYNN